MQRRNFLDYLLFASRTFLVLAFLVNLMIGCVGYCILPDQLVSRANPDYEIGLHNSFSKEFFCGFFIALSTFLFLLCYIFMPYMAKPSTKPITSTKYWDQKENLPLRFKITCFWETLGCSAMLVSFARSILRYFPVNLITPRQGNADNIFDFLLLQCTIILFFFVFPWLTFFLLKNVRQRKTPASNTTAQ